MENERGRGGEKAVVAENRGEREEREGAPKEGRGAEREKRRRKEREGKPGELRGSIGGHRPPQKSAHYHPGTKGRRRGDDARFINIYRRTLNSSLVANENRYRGWSWRSSPRDLMMFYGRVYSEFNYFFLKSSITPAF